MKVGEERQGGIRRDVDSESGIGERMEGRGKEGMIFVIEKRMRCVWIWCVDRGGWEGM